MDYTKIDGLIEKDECLELYELQCEIINSETLTDNEKLLRLVIMQTNCPVDDWENGGGYVGLERRANGQPFEYWISMFTPANTTVPEGFAYMDFSEVNLGTCWIYGKEKEVHNTKACKGAVIDQGLKLWTDDNGGVWSFENCTCPRYTTPDEQGNIIMDYCYFVK